MSLVDESMLELDLNEDVLVEEKHAYNIDKKDVINVCEDPSLMERAARIARDYGYQNREKLLGFHVDVEDYVQDMMLNMLTRQGFKEFYREYTLDKRFDKVVLNACHNQIIDYQKF